MIAVDRRFQWQDEAAIKAFVAQRSFAHIFAMTAAGPMVAHAPVVLTAGGHLRVHLARANRLCRYLDGLPVVATIAGPDGYVSPDWYASPDQVPTWNYQAVDADGVARLLDRAALIEQVDDLSAVHEARLAPKPAWTRAKMPPGRFEAMLPAIAAYEIEVVRWRGTAKLSQNKRAEDRAAVAAAFEGAGQRDLAALMVEP